MTFRHLLACDTPVGKIDVKNNRNTAFCDEEIKFGSHIRGREKRN